MPKPFPGCAFGGWSGNLLGAGLELHLLRALGFHFPGQKGLYTLVLLLFPSFLGRGGGEEEVGGVGLFLFFCF